MPIPTAPSTPTVPSTPAARTPTDAPEAVATPVVLYQVRDLAAVLHREADAVRAAVTRLNAYALTMHWQSSSARACLDELAEFAGRATRFAVGYDDAASLVLAHAEQAEANAAAAVRTLAQGPFGLV